MKIVDVPIDQITIDAGTQQRASINEEHVADLQAAIASVITLPPVKIFADGVHRYLSRGFHRYHAHLKAGKKTIRAEVVQGTLDDAIVDSLGDNVEHTALKLTNADKIKKVTTALKLPSLSKQSDRALADLCGVSNTFVGRVRSSLSTVDSEKPKNGDSESKTPVTTPPTERTYTTRHGTSATMNTANIGKKADAKEEPKPAPKKEAEKKPAPAKVETPANEELPELDETDWPIPENLRDIFADRAPFTKAASTISGVKSGMKDLANIAAGHFFSGDMLKDVESRLLQIRQVITGDAQPYAVCRTCGGRKGGCKNCDKQGWLAKNRFEQTTPKELLAMKPPKLGKGKAA